MSILGHFCAFCDHNAMEKEWVWQAFDDTFVFSLSFLLQPQNLASNGIFLYSQKTITEVAEAYGYKTYSRLLQVKITAF